MIEGHRASDWPKDPTWTGKVKIISRGRVCSIILLDNDNKIFAVCYASEDGAVERTLDSGRYFVLRITNQQGRHAFIGIAFNERNDAFDFNVTLSEFKNEIEREDQANKLTLESTSAIVQPLKDMSLKDGEKIKIKLISSNKKKNDENPSTIGNKLTLLPPPRGGGATASIAPTASTISSTINNSNTIKTSSPVFNADPFNSDPFSTDPFSTSSSNAQSSTNVFSFGTSSSSAASPLLSSDPFATQSDPFASNNDPFSSNSDPFQTTTTGTATSTHNTNNNKQSSSTTSSSSSSNLLDF